MSPEAIIFCNKCNFNIKGNLPNLSGGVNSFKYPRDKEIDEKLAEKLIEHHIESGRNETRGHKDFSVTVNGDEKHASIEASSYYVEYYKSGTAEP